MTQDHGQECHGQEPKPGAAAGWATRLTIGPGHDGLISGMCALAVSPLPMSFDAADPQLQQQLAEASRAFEATSNDPERNCWLAVHQHVHGVLPSEYDIRDIPEDLYLAVLALRRAQLAAAAIG